MHWKFTNWPKCAVWLKIVYESRPLSDLNWAKTEQKLSKNWAKIEQKLSENWGETEGKLSRNWAKTEENLAKTERKLSENFGKVTKENQKVSQNFTFVKVSLYYSKKILKTNKSQIGFIILIGFVVIEH